MANAGQPLPEPVSLRIVMRDENELPVVFCNHVALVRQGEQWFLTFAQVVPPVVMGSQVEQTSQLRARGEVEARIIARIVMDSERIAEVAKLLQGIPSDPGSGASLSEKPGPGD